MNLQTYVTNIVQAARAEDMKVSTQLTLGELILKLEAVKNKTLPILFDVEPYYPTNVDSWRGSYCELALNYREEGTPKTTETILVKLKVTIGMTLTGYKGGDFLMGKTTPVWVANHGESLGFRTEAETAVVDVVELEDSIIIKTEALGY